MPPCSKSFLNAASSVIVNLSLSFISLFIMAVITSDSDLLPLCRIIIVNEVACNQLPKWCFSYFGPKIPVSEQPVYVNVLCRERLDRPVPFVLKR